jgi:hypothetical protein
MDAYAAAAAPRACTVLLLLQVQRTAVCFDAMIEAG